MNVGTDGLFGETRNSDQESLNDAFPKTLIKDIQTVIRYGYRVPGVTNTKIYFGRENIQEAEDFVFSKYFELESEKQQLLSSNHFALRNFVYNTLRKFGSLLKRRERALKEYRNSLGVPIALKQDETWEDDDVLIPFPIDEILRERKELLELGISSLSKEQQNLIEDYFYKGETIKKISTKAGKSCQAIHRKIWQILTLLKKRINNTYQKDYLKINCPQIIETLLKK